MQDVSMRCDTLIQIRAPETLAKALTAAADKRLTSRSDYIRGALLDRLRADEIDVKGDRADRQVS
jgi:metal-responsive CopG/Arc/MetJ family transcriptional regulator